MSRTLSLLCIALVACALTGCAKPLEKPVNNPEVQRGHAHEAQGELSSEVRK
jgi:hypothetical protein